jgi:hypothetical protein
MKPEELAALLDRVRGLVAQLEKSVAKAVGVVHERTGFVSKGVVPLDRTNPV